ALQERSDINKRISELRRRLENCLLVQEGEEPEEDPMDLLNECKSADALVINWLHFSKVKIGSVEP
ncbi:MAG: hypothetical protein II489_06280, partial [Bacteroidaceae bacterium]|nr:hypothetical protein [Bacteroidaceae bacterium]